MQRMMWTAGKTTAQSRQFCAELLRFSPVVRRIIGSSNHSRVGYEPALCFRISVKNANGIHVNQPLTIDRFRSADRDDATSR